MEVRANCLSKKTLAQDRSLVETPNGSPITGGKNGGEAREIKKISYRRPEGPVVEGVVVVVVVAIWAAFRIFDIRFLVHHV